MIKVAITDYSFPSLDVEAAVLEPLGCILVPGQCKQAGPLIELTSDADHVITQFAPITAEVIESMRRARVIVRYGIGVDNVDLDAARKKGIPVCNVPDYCIDEVADHTLAFLLAATRQLAANHLALRAGKWGLAVPLERMRTLRDLTVGIVGFGRIGREVARRVVPFKCRWLAFDPVVPGSEIAALGGTPANLDQLLAECDVLTLHCPSTASTRGMINSQSLAKMKPGSILVNVGRGDLVDMPALIEALESGRLAGASLDVFVPEPLAPDSRLLAMENVVVSSHIASASVKASRQLRETAAGIVARSIRGEPLPNIVNGL